MSWPYSVPFSLNATIWSIFCQYYTKELAPTIETVLKNDKTVVNGTGAIEQYRILKKEKQR